MQTSGEKFEALLYTADPRLAAEYVKSFDKFPANWISFNEPRTAADFLAKDHFDFIILDLEGADGRSLLDQLCDSGKTRQSVIFAVTSGAVDPSSLARCYKFGVFYPVRPSEIYSNLHRSIPVAERLGQHRAALASEAQPAVLHGEGSNSEIPEVVKEVFHTSKALAWVVAAAASSILLMKHSLGIAAQERAASLLSAVATMWFVQESTENFRGLLDLAPPSAGPTYLVALSLLLWLCAKQRRLGDKGRVPMAARNSAY